MTPYGRLHLASTNRYVDDLVAHIRLWRGGQRRAVFSVGTDGGGQQSRDIAVDAALLAGIAVYAEANDVSYTERFEPGSELSPTEVATYCIVLTGLCDAGREPAAFPPELFAAGGVGPELKLIYEAAQKICRPLVR